MISREKRHNEVWFTEESTKHLRLSLRVTGELVRKETPYQSLLALETAEYGRMLVLDGAIQVTEKDEFCYHEMMAHVALCSHPNPKKVLIVGGGDGGSLREAVKHESVEKAVLVDIDEEVINTSREFFPTLSCAMDDPKAEIRPMDAMDYMKDHRGEFDVIIVDATDPVDMAAGLFQSPFYRDVWDALSDDGFMVTHIESPFTDAAIMVPAYRAMKEVFPSVHPYLGFMPTYPSGMWVYAIGSKRHDPSKPLRESPEGLKYYTSDVHKGSFALPPFLVEMLEKGEKVESHY
ncbi:MAG: polyamine aminopropyltransferase [Synergistota bacterium]|nr:polyamine aminopropyltransferase [Synergistota bacterium]